MRPAELKKEWRWLPDFGQWHYVWANYDPYRGAGCMVGSGTHFWVWPGSCSIIGEQDWPMRSVIFLAKDDIMSKHSAADNARQDVYAAAKNFVQEMELCDLLA